MEFSYSQTENFEMEKLSSDTRYFKKPVEINRGIFYFTYYTFLPNKHKRSFLHTYVHFFICKFQKCPPPTDLFRPTLIFGTLEYVLLICTCTKMACIKGEKCHLELRMLTQVTNGCNGTKYLLTHTYLH